MIERNAQNEKRFEEINRKLLHNFDAWHLEGKLSFDWKNTKKVNKHLRELLGFPVNSNDLHFTDLDDFSQIEWLASQHAWALYQAVLIKRGMW